MKIFLTGGTGFVGTHFLKQSLAGGHQVVALKRPGSKTRLPLENQPTWIEGALDNDYTNEFEGVDTFVHLASHTPNPPYDSLERCLYWNVYTSVKLARQAHDAGVKNFIIAGTCTEYGEACQKFDFLSPETPLEPSLSYPTSKAAASIAFTGLARELDLKLKILRIFQVYGEGESERRLWPALRKAALAGEDFPMSPGEQIRDFIDVTEVTRQLIAHLDFTTIKEGKPIVAHIATGQSTSLLEFSQTWWEHWKAKGNLQPGKFPYRRNEMMRIATNKNAIQ